MTPRPEDLWSPWPKTAASSSWYHLSSSWYHLTDNPNFAFDPEHRPENNALTVSPGEYPPGMFVTRDPEHWYNGKDYVRPFVAEIHGPDDLQEGRWGHESFLPAERFPEAQVSRVMPYDAWANEHFNSEPYTGADVRQMGPEQHAQHFDQTNQYIRDARPNMLSFPCSHCGENATYNRCEYCDKTEDPNFDKYQIRAYLPQFKGTGDFYTQHKQSNLTSPPPCPTCGGNMDYWMDQSARYNDGYAHCPACRKNTRINFDEPAYAMLWRDRVFPEKVEQMAPAPWSDWMEPKQGAAGWGEEPFLRCPQCDQDRVVEDADTQTGEMIRECYNCGWHEPMPQQQAQHPDPWMDNEPGSLTVPKHWGKTASPFDPYGRPVTDRGNSIPRGEYYRPGNQQRFLDDFRNWDIDKLLDERKRIQGPPLKGIAWPGANYNKALQQAIQERTQQPGMNAPSTHPAMQKWYDQGLDEAEQSVLPQGLARTAATRTQLLQQVRHHEEEHGPDTSALVHDFGDGWTIRAPMSAADHQREGNLMGNCVGDVAVEQPEDEWHVPMASAPYYHSLRDPDNIPRATWSTYGGEPALGRHNGPVKPEYGNYLDQWGADYVSPEDVCPNCNSTYLHPTSAGVQCESCLQMIPADHPARRFASTQPLVDHQAHIYTRPSKRYQTLDFSGTRASAWAPEGWDAPEPYSPQGDRCPMCKNHRLIHMPSEDQQTPDSLICPECNWAGERAPDWLRESAASTYYHVAPQEARDSILANGLDHTLGQRGTDYGGYINNEPGNYLWASAEHARNNLASKHDFDGTRPWDLYQVDANGLDLRPDQEWGGCHYTPEPIGPERLRLLTDQHTANGPQTIYHTAPRSAQASILANGINPALSEHGRWANDKGFYGFTDPEEARWYADYMGNLPPAESFDVYQVQATHPLGPGDDPHLESEVYHPEPVGPEHVSLYRDQHTAAMTGPQKQRRIHHLQEKFGPDQSKVMHEYPDGWTVNQLPSWDEVAREGEMMHHCWSDPYPLAVDSGSSLNEPPGTVGGQYLSLRDPENWPHASFHYNPDQQAIWDAWGHGDNELRPEHQQRILDWFGQQHPGVELPYDDTFGMHESAVQDATTLAYTVVPPPNRAPNPRSRIGKLADNIGNLPDTQPSPHLLNHTPKDQHVRGLIEENGRVHTWPEDWATHGQYAAANDLSQQRYAPFYLDQDNTGARVYGPAMTSPVNLMHLQTVLPNLRFSTYIITQLAIPDLDQQWLTYHNQVSEIPRAEIPNAPVSQLTQLDRSAHAQYVCPKCGTVFDTDSTRYCPNCGLDATTPDDPRLGSVNALANGSQCTCHKGRAFRSPCCRFCDRGGQLGPNISTQGSPRLSGPLSDGTRHAMAVTPEFLGELGPLYHGTSEDRAQRILAEGLHPGQEQNWSGALSPRPGHIYLTSDPEHARRKHGPVVFQVDPSQLDPQHVSPDEDLIPDSTRRQHMNDYSTLGDMAEGIGWGEDPQQSQEAITSPYPSGVPRQQFNIAYRGSIPATALNRISGQLGTQDLNREGSHILGSHRLWWKPGDYGRGLVDTATKTVHTWPEEEGEHEQMADAKGIQEFVPFNIRPDGHIWLDDEPTEPDGTRWGDYKPLIEQAMGGRGTQARNGGGPSDLRYSAGPLSRMSAYDPDLSSDALGCPKCGQPIEPTYKPDSTWVPHFRCEHCGFDASVPGESGAIGTPYTPEEKLEAWEHVMTSPAFDTDPLLVKPQNWNFGPVRQGAVTESAVDRALTCPNCHNNFQYDRTQHDSQVDCPFCQHRVLDSWICPKPGCHMDNFSDAVSCGNCLTPNPSLGDTVPTSIQDPLEEQFRMPSGLQWDDRRNSAHYPEVRATLPSGKLERVAGDWWDETDIYDPQRRPRHQSPWPWQQGLCGTYACALMREHPQLRFGVLSGDDAGTHYFAHDDNYAYDSLGRHPLPYLGTKNQWNPEEMELDSNPGWYGVPDEEAGPEGSEVNVERARQHIRATNPFETDAAV